MSIVFAVHLLSTAALVGLIWIVQLVSYPLFAHVRQGFTSYHTAHCDRITFVVGPLMGAEGLTALWLLEEPPPGVSMIWIWGGLALIAINVLATAFVSVPLHNRLGRGYDEDTIAKLVRTNWIRTFAWTARGILVGWIAVVAYAAPAS